MHKELAEKITQDILDFINKTKKQINKTTNPYYEETELKESFCLIDRTSFENQREWLKLKFFLEKGSPPENVITLKLRLLAC